MHPNSLAGANLRSHSKKRKSYLICVSRKLRKQSSTSTCLASGLSPPSLEWLAMRNASTRDKSVGVLTQNRSLRVKPRAINSCHEIRICSTDAGPFSPSRYNSTLPVKWLPLTECTKIVWRMFFNRSQRRIFSNISPPSGNVIQLSSDKASSWRRGRKQSVHVCSVSSGPWYCTRTSAPAANICAMMAPDMFFVQPSAREY